MVSLQLLPPGVNHLSPRFGFCSCAPPPGLRYPPRTLGPGRSEFSACPPPFSFSRDRALLYGAQAGLNSRSSCLNPHSQIGGNHEIWWGEQDPRKHSPKSLLQGVFSGLRRHAPFAIQKMCRCSAFSRPGLSASFFLPVQPLSPLVSAFHLC